MFPLKPPNLVQGFPRDWLVQSIFASWVITVGPGWLDIPSMWLQLSKLLLLLLLLRAKHTLLNNINKRLKTQQSLRLSFSSSGQCLQRSIGILIGICSLCLASTWRLLAAHLARLKHLRFNCVHTWPGATGHVVWVAAAWKKHLNLNSNVSGL